MLKGMPLVIFAFIIDLLQAGISLSLAGLSGSLAWVPFAGQAGLVAGVGLGMAINASISLTAGVGHTFATYMTLLENNPRFKSRVQAIILRRLGIAFFGEVIPGINNLPLWTITTLLILRAVAKEQKKAAATAPAAAPAAPQRPVMAKVGATMGAVVLMLGAGGMAQAQAPEPVRYIVSPETPGPEQEVSIIAEGVGGFLGDAAITWTVDGKVMKQGVGEREMAVMTGPLGSRTVVGVSISSPTQGSFSRTFTLAPSVVTMLWEADTTVPPLYRGKALYSAGSRLKVLAFPTVFVGGSRVAQSALSYQWSRGDEPDTEASGLGRSTYAFAGDQLKAAEEVAVDVYYGNAKVARGTATIAAAAPRVVLYQYDALRGVVYDAAIPPAISLAAREITIKAEPYYYARESRNATLVYDWQLSGETISGPDSARGILTLRQAGEGGGSATLGVSLQNFDSSKLVQAAETTLQLVFGQSSGSALRNFFGL